MAWGNSVFNQNPAYSLYYMHAKQDIVTQGFRKGREKNVEEEIFVQSIWLQKRGLNILAVALIIKTIIESDSLKN